MVAGGYRDLRGRCANGGSSFEGFGEDSVASDYGYTTVSQLNGLALCGLNHTKPENSCVHGGC